MANNAKIKAAGIDPVIQTYGDTWTSQLFVLGDFHNVAAAEPDLAEKYTANQAKYATTPAALEGFQHLQAGPRGRLPEQGLRLGQARRRPARCWPTGKGAHYPMLTVAVGQHRRRRPRTRPRTSASSRCPATTPRKNGLTVWPPGGVYIPKTTDGRQARRGQEVPRLRRQPGRLRRRRPRPARRPARTWSRAARCRPTCRRRSRTCSRTSTSRQRPAWRWSSSPRSRARRSSRSPSRSAPASARPTDGAALYDEDVKKQAQQLGLPGW